MKKRIWDVERLTAWERSVRADEREKVLAEFSKSQRECYEFASKIMQRTAAFRLAKDLAPASISVPAGIVAPKRKAVTASSVQIDSVFAALESVDAGTSLTNKHVQEITKLGPKIVGAALKRLIADAWVIEKPRGKFVAVHDRTAQTADGATSEVP